MGEKPNERLDDEKILLVEAPRLEDEKRAAEAFLTMPQEMFERDKRGKLSLLFLMVDWDVDIVAIAKKAAKQFGYRNPQDLYDQLTKEEQRMVKEKIAECYNSDDFYMKYRAVALTGALQLAEFIDNVVEICAKIEKFPEEAKADITEILYTKDFDEAEVMDMADIVGKALRQLGEAAADGKIVVNDDIIEKIIPMIKESRTTVGVDLLNLIPKEKMDDDLKIAELRYMVNEVEGAENAAKLHGYLHPQDIYKDLSEERKKKLKKKIDLYFWKGRIREAANILKGIPKEELDDNIMEWIICMIKEYRTEVGADLLNLIPKEKMDDDLKIAELYYVTNEVEGAENAAKLHGYLHPQDIYKDLSEEGKKKLKKKIDLYFREGRIREAANILKGIPKEELDDDLKTMEFYIAYFWDLQEPAKLHGYLHPRDLYTKLRRQDQRKIIEEIKDLLESTIRMDKPITRILCPRLGVDFNTIRTRKAYIGINLIVNLRLVELMDTLVDHIYGGWHHWNYAKEKAYKAIEQIGEDILAGKVAAQEKHLNKTINLLTKSNNPDHKALAERLTAYLRNKDKSTKINRDGVFRRVGGKDQWKKKPLTN